MNECIVCGRPGDRHHIIHKEEGGIDFPLNVVYLCEEHHRGKTGPHRDPSVDYQYKKAMQDRLMRIFCKPYYTKKEIRTLTGVTASTLTSLAKSLKRHKEGYASSEIIFYLMGGNMIKDEDFYIE